MVFSSVVFLFVFLPVVLLCYFVAPVKIRNVILLIASLVFYAWGEPVYILLMIGSTLVAYISGLLIGRFQVTGHTKNAKITLIVALVIHLGLLGIFKYTDFFIDNINAIFHTSIKNAELALPIGISFYTFQILSYVIDAYKGKVAIQRNFINLATYVALFPQLIAGPIVRYETVEAELNERTTNYDTFAEGMSRFVVGLSKKVLLANTIGELYTTVHALNADSQSVVMLWLASIAYTLQIYYDFSGYSDMAIGLGKIFGFNFLENFNYPYMSGSITEFWRRWHISLSSWFRDYVYIPLGGNRKGAAKQYRNILIVWFLTGFWHGANWNFIVWGLYFCLFLCIEKLGLLKKLDALPKAVGHIYTLILVVISWTIFADTDMGNVLTTIKGMFFLDGLSFTNARTTGYLASYGLLMLIGIIGATDYPKKLYVKLMRGQESDNVDTAADEVSAAVSMISANENKQISMDGNRQISVNGNAAAEDVKDKINAKDIIEIILLVAAFIISVAYLVSASFNPFLYFRF